MGKSEEQFQKSKKTKKKQYHGVTSKNPNSITNNTSSLLFNVYLYL